MRKLIYTINLTIDGCCDHTKGGVPDDDLYYYYIALLKSADTFLYGRKTYELMVPYWPDIAKKPTDDTESDYEYALAFEAVDNMVVFSKTLQNADRHNTNIVRDNLKEEILKLKQQQGKNILTGGIDIPSQLMELGLIDELRIVVMPVVVGEGRRLFDDISLERLKWKLADTKIFKSGSVALHYVKG